MEWDELARGPSSHNINPMMKYIILTLALALFAWAVAAARTVTITSSTITLESAETVDLTTAGKLFVQEPQDEWVKNGKTMYPDKTDRTAAVITAQGLFFDNLDIYVKAAIEGGFYTQAGEGSGLALTSQTTVDYIAVCMEDGVFCELYIRQNNKQYILNLYPDLSAESVTASTARADMLTQINIVIEASNTGGFWD